MNKIKPTEGKIDREWMEYKIDEVHVVKDDMYYVCRYDPNTWRCGKCLRGKIKAVWSYAYTCRVCGAKVKKFYYRQGFKLMVFTY